MNLYKGKLVVDIVTAVESNDEDVMTEKAHEGFTPELFNEIMALLGAKGYIYQSIGATLKDEGIAHDMEVELIEENKREAIKRTKSIYNKANQITIKL